MRTSSNWQPAGHGLLVSALACFLLLACGGPTPEPTATPPLSASYEDLARHYAPVIYQGAGSDQDYITAVDFDGDWIGNNNWENQPDGDLSAYVYYSVIETHTHWFIFYSLFHPRDYIFGDCDKEEGCHENDMESLQMVVEKDGSAYGQLKALETLAHGEIYLYTHDDTVTAGFLRQSGGIQREDEHPVVYVESAGHGIYGRRMILVPAVVVYRVGDETGVPTSIKDKNALYKLVPIYDTLWAHHGEIGDGWAFDQPFDYRGHILPAAIDGADYGEDKANTPWGYNQATGDQLSRGDWFLDPARALAYHARFTGEFSLEYVYNPYLADLGLGK